MAAVNKPPPERQNMKLCKYMLLSLQIFLCLALTGCGKQNVSDIQAEYEGLVFSEQAREGILLGIQYDGRRKVLIWADENGNIFLSEDGKETDKLLFQNVKKEWSNALCQWWIASDGRYYILHQENVTVLNQEGKELFSGKADGYVNEICSTADGVIVLKIDNMEGIGTKLAVMDSGTGAIENKLSLKKGVIAIAKGQKKDILLVDMEGICDLNLEDGSREWYLKWNGTSYTPGSGIQDIRYVSDSQIEFLKSDYFQETIKNVLPEDMGKTVLKYRATVVSESMKEQIVRFNQENTDYYIVVEECGEGMSYAAFQEKTDMEIAAGYGPDIVCGSAVNSVYSLLKKGALVDLSPYLEKSGITEGDYFPAAFDQWRMGEALYGIGTQISINAMCLDKALMEGTEVLDMETLLEKLGNYSGQAVFAYQYDSESILQYFLMMSKDLYGMVDWEKGTCDFGSGLWRDMLETAKQLGDSDSRNGYDKLGVRAFYDSFPLSSAFDNAVKERGMDVVGYPAEEGMVLQAAVSIFGINAHSKHPEGAWAFLEFLLGEETQKELSKSLGFPVKRSVYKECAREALDNQEPTNFSGMGLEGSTEGITLEQITALEEYIRRAQVRPLYTEPLLRIIEEEAQEYFAGSKSIEEVSAVIENRIQLYLKENKN